MGEDMQVLKQVFGQYSSLLAERLERNIWNNNFPANKSSGWRWRQKSGIENVLYLKIIKERNRNNKQSQQIIVGHQRQSSCVVFSKELSPAGFQGFKFVHAVTTIASVN